MVKIIDTAMFSAYDKMNSNISEMITEENKKKIAESVSKTAETVK